MTAGQLYEHDFFEWTQCTAALLRAGRFDQADIEPIAEEIEDMGKRERRELQSRLEALLQYLLKWQMQTDRRGRSWQGTINIQRRDIARLFKEMPSLKHKLETSLAEAHEYAKFKAAVETGIPAGDFPFSCPFTLDQIPDQELLPE
jgi:ribosomal protein L29